MEQEQEQKYNLGTIGFSQYWLTRTGCVYQQTDKGFRPCKVYYRSSTGSPYVKLYSNGKCCSITIAILMGCYFFGAEKGKVDAYIKDGDIFNLHLENIVLFPKPIGRSRIEQVQGFPQEYKLYKDAYYVRKNGEVWYIPKQEGHIYGFRCKEQREKNRSLFVFLGQQKRMSLAKLMLHTYYPFLNMSHVMWRYKDGNPLNVQLDNLSFITDRGLCSDEYLCRPVFIEKDGERKEFNTLWEVCGYLLSMNIVKEYNIRVFLNLLNCLTLRKDFQGYVIGYVDKTVFSGLPKKDKYTGIEISYLLQVKVEGLYTIIKRKGLEWEQINGIKYLSAQSFFHVYSERVYIDDTTNLVYPKTLQVKPAEQFLTAQGVTSYGVEIQTAQGECYRFNTMHGAVQYLHSLYPKTKEKSIMESLSRLFRKGRTTYKGITIKKCSVEDKKQGTV